MIFHADFLRHICFQNELTYFYKEATHNSIRAVTIWLFHVNIGETQSGLKYYIGQFSYSYRSIFVSGLMYRPLKIKNLLLKVHSHSNMIFAYSRLFDIWISTLGSKIKFTFLKLLIKRPADYLFWTPTFQRKVSCETTIVSRSVGQLTFF